MDQDSQPRLPPPRHHQPTPPHRLGPSLPHHPVLIEIFVETPRYTGAFYEASGWTHVGTTRGRGRYDTLKLYDKPKKDVWLRRLTRHWRRTLNR